MDFIAALDALAMLPTPSDMFPGLSTHGALVECVRLVGLWCGLGVGALCIYLGIITGTNDRHQ